MQNEQYKRNNKRLVIRNPKKHHAEEYSFEKANDFKEERFLKNL
jgi:hypothetical protein